MENKPIEAQDDFSFETFLSDDSKKELGIVADPAQAEPVIAPAVTDNLQVKTEVAETPSPQETVVTPATTVQTVSESDLPVRAPNEPEWKYNLRVEIAERQKAITDSSTPAEKEAVKVEVNSIRRQIAQRSKVEPVTADPILPDNYDPNAFKNDIEKFNVLAKGAGFVHQSEIADTIRQQTAMEREFETVGRAESDFRLRHPDLKDQAKYDNLVNFVLDNFIIQGKSYNGLTAILETAKDMLYPSNVENKVVATQELSKKMDAVDFSGSTAAESVDPVKAERKALIEDIKKTSGNDFGWALD